MTTYARADLLGLRPTARPTLGSYVRKRVQYTSSAYVGVAARASRPPAVLRPTGNGAYTVIGNRPPARRYRRVYGSNRWILVRVPVIAQRHTQPVGCNLVFGSMNGMVWYTRV